MSSGCHCFALRLLTRDQDSQPVTMDDAIKPSHTPETMNKMLVRLRTLYLDGWITAADNGGVNENGFPSAWLAFVVPRCFLPVITSTGALTKFSTRMILC